MTNRWDEIMARIEGPTEEEMLDRLCERVRDVMASFKTTNTLIHPDNAREWAALVDFEDQVPYLRRQREWRFKVKVAKELFAQRTATGAAPEGELIHLGYKGIPGPNTPRVYPCLCGYVPSHPLGSKIVYDKHDQHPICKACDNPMVFVTSRDAELYAEETKAYLAQEGQSS